ncbi:phage tail tape measure protein [Streptomyces liangshanensis]|uniref:phage tail tape measure protein n=1 Tax=Streptomyces liangshanensis TaxID=2717324 RepID=UPI0036DF47AC
MSLTVGELTAHLVVDDTAVDPGLRRAEAALRTSGSRMADDAERAGAAAGDALGEGLVRGADGRIRNARGQFVAAGRTAGDGVGDGLTAGTADGAEEAVQAGESRLDKLKMAAAGIGLAAGAALMGGMTQALDQGRIVGIMQAKIGATPAVAEKYGKIAGRLFANGITADFQTAADTMTAIAQNGLIPTAATEKQLELLGTRVGNTATVLGEEVAAVSATVGKMVKTGMARDAGEAMDILIRAQQKGLNSSEDLLDTFDEYSTQFRKVGIDGKVAMGLVSQALEGGARDTDIAADAIKEFSLLSIDGSKAAAEAYKALGLDADKMIKTLAAGGPGAKAAMDTIFDNIRGLEDPVKKNTVAIGLFGTKFEDLGGAFDKMDPSKAAAKFGSIKGAVDSAGNAMGGSASAQLSSFIGKLQQAGVEVLGGQVIPQLVAFGNWCRKNPGEVKIVAGVIGGVLVTALVLMGVTATVRSAQVVVAWVRAGAASLLHAGRQVVAAGRVVASWVLMGLRASLQALRVVAGWVVASAGAALNAGLQVVAAGRVVAGWVLMGVQSMIQAGRMAAAWFIALGPIGWVIAAIVGLGLLIWANWDKIKGWTAAAWDWVWGKLKAFGSWAIAFFMKWNIVSVMIRAWEGVRKGVVGKATALLGWLRGLPGRISSGLSSLNSLLVDKGVAVVQGLWSGIRSMGGWIRSQIMSWARDVIPGPIAKALGIASPSKVTTAQGRWIARGLAAGLTGSAKQVRAAATKVADIVRDGLAPGKKRAVALGKISAGSKALVTLANREASLAARMKATSKSITDQIKARDKLAADVAKGVLDGANITSSTAEGPVTADTILNNLVTKLNQARQFASQLAALRKKGVRADLISQIAQAGVEQGTGAAAALATASTSQIQQINSTQGALVTAAGQAGATAGNAMYGAGIQAAQGLVKGLKSQQSAIERQMATIAKGMTTAIRKALGIKSPSKVMAAMVGQHIPTGIAAGMAGGQRTLDTAMANLVRPPAVPIGAAGGMYGARGRAGAAQPIQIEIRSSGSRMSDLLTAELRKSIQIKGGNVQLALGA